MTKQLMITKHQYDELCELGLKYDAYFMQGPTMYNLPFVDYVINWLMYKFNIIIYCKIEPFVSPSRKKEILYRYAVKYCNINMGWNGRVYIGESRLGPNPYVLKRECITLAIKYLKNGGIR